MSSPMSYPIVASLCLFLAPLCLIGSGCKSTGPDQAEGTASSVSALETALQASSEQISAANAALNQILANPEGDLRPSYDAFSGALSKLESNAKAVGKHAADMRTKAQAYFANWEKNLATIQSEDVRERSAERRTKMVERQEEGNERVNELKQSFDSYVTRMKDVHTFLGNDLNSGGVDSISGEAKKTMKEGEEVREGIDKVASKLAELRKAISAQGPATPQPAP